MSSLNLCEDLNGTDGSRIGPLRTMCYPDASTSFPRNGEFNARGTGELEVCGNSISFAPDSTQGCRSRKIRDADSASRVPCGRRGFITQKG